MIRRQDRNNLTRDRSTLAKAPRSLTHQACTPLDAKVKEKEDGRSTATATIVASLGMKNATSMTRQRSVVCGATVSWSERCEPATQALALLDDTNGLLTIFVRDDFHTPRFPESCTANFLSALLFDPTLSTAWTTTIACASCATFLQTRTLFATICRSVWQWCNTSFTIFGPK